MSEEWPACPCIGFFCEPRPACGEDCGLLVLLRVKTCPLPSPPPCLAKEYRSSRRHIQAPGVLRVGEICQESRCAPFFCLRGFAWYSPGAVLWRSRVGEIGAVLGVEDTGGIKRKLGPKWAYRLRDTITSASDEDWQLVLHCLAPAGPANVTFERKG